MLSEAIGYFGVDGFGGEKSHKGVTDEEIFLIKIYKQVISINLMEREIMIKILEVLEMKFPYSIGVGELGQEIKAKRNRITIDKIEPIISYLKQSGKIMVQHDSLDHHKLGGAEQLTIVPAGIDYLTQLKELREEKRRNYLSLDTTIVLTQIAIIGIILSLIEKFNLNLSNPSFKIPWLLSAIFWIIFVTFSMLLFYKVIGIIFSKESWRGIFFDRNND